MTELLLVTGFLGAGKTTLIRKLAGYFSGRRLALLINEFGRTGVDGELLRDCAAALAEVNSGSIFCSCRAGEFETALAALVAKNPDIIIVEASGLSDPTNLRELLAGGGALEGIRYLGALCVLDALNFEKVLATARPCARQLAAACFALLNKCDLAEPEKIERAIRLVHEHRPGLPVLKTSWCELPEGWEGLLSAESGECAPGIQSADLALRRHTLSINEGASAPELFAMLKDISKAAQRIKGFVKLSDGYYTVDCVGEAVCLEHIEHQPSNLGVLNVLSGGGSALLPVLKKAESEYSLMKITE